MCVWLALKQSEEIVRIEKRSFNCQDIRFQIEIALCLCKIRHTRTQKKTEKCDFNDFALPFTFEMNVYVYMQHFLINDILKRRR